MARCPLALPGRHQCLPWWTENRLLSPLPKQKTCFDRPEMPWVTSKFSRPSESCQILPAPCTHAFHCFSLFLHRVDSKFHTKAILRRMFLHNVLLESLLRHEDYHPSSFIMARTRVTVCGTACRGFPYNIFSAAPTGRSLALRLPYRQSVMCSVHRGATGRRRRIGSLSMKQCLLTVERCEVSQRILTGGVLVRNLHGRSGLHGETGAVHTWEMTQNSYP